MEQLVEIERHDGVALVRLNRPEARNAVNAAMAEAIVDAMGLVQDAHCIVLTGADPAFCAGLDLRDLGIDKLGDLAPFVASVASSEVPVIAAVNGPAVTGGFEIALACDFMIAGPNARFADTHVRVGVYPGPVLVDLPRLVGMAFAREMSLTGNFVDAETAQRVGLVNHLVDHDRLVPFALELATAIAEQDPSMVNGMRRDWDETGGLPLAEAHARHIENSRAGGFSGATGDAIAARREAVIARAKTQPGA
jgi:enoyl-CoA hydratase/carnithine racemase